jgi:hypothetical protein
MTGGPEKPKRRRRLPKRTAAAVATVLIAYGGLAYIIAPEFWSIHDRGDTLHLDSYLTTTPQGIPGDPINLGFYGTKQQLIHVFAVAGWHAADAITFRSSIEIGESVVFDRPYQDAPVSTLIYEGRKQDLAFEKPVGTSADKRNHLRIWLTPKTNDDGVPLWLGSASFDHGVGLSHDTGQITHHIGPDLDAERDLVVSDLQATGLVASVTSVEGIGPTKDGRNGGGDPYFTDGMVKVCTLGK